MATRDYWSEAPMNRQQTVLFGPTLDSTIREDDPVRLFDEVLAGLDWSSWEAEYDGTRGQPPIHPRFMAGALLYGLCRGIRSSRKLEEACRYRLDFMWLVEGRKIDHTTLAKFRTKFAEPLKDLFKQIGRVAMSMGLIRLCEVAFDGTRVKANNSRSRCHTAKTLEEKLQALDKLFEEMLTEAQAADTAEASQPTSDGDDDNSPTQLPGPLADLKQRRERVREALAKAQQADTMRQTQGVNPETRPVQVPTTDLDSRLMPNKGGGYAPNYTPTATTDGHRGFIVDCEVISDVNETKQAAASVDRIEETFGQKPTKFLTDGGNNSGAVMQEMEERGVEFYAPAAVNQPQEDHPAKRDDPREPIPTQQWPDLPRNKAGRLHNSCFVYAAKEDQYYCPQGKPLPFVRVKSAARRGLSKTWRIYRCKSCKDCLLAGVCYVRVSHSGRTISRDQYEPMRERTATRMATVEGRQLYNQRPHMAETPFGIIKAAIGLRQFLLRGLPKVKTEWRWAATAFNLGKLVREIARLRAECASLSVQVAG
jgi:transposase